MKPKLIISTFFLLLSLSLFSQQHFYNVDSIRQTLEPDETKFLIEHFIGDSIVSQEIISTKSNENQTNQRYIVRFKNDPIYNSDLKSARATKKIHSDHEQFKKDIADLLQKSNTIQLKSADQIILREYTKAINGVAIELPADIVEEVRKLDYVSKIEVDGSVQINNSIFLNNLINPQIGYSSSYTGKGIVIAILDTGIDTTHECFSGNKFVKGYNFVDNNENTFDDNRHGTHCAGIASANSGEITGVAPDSKLMPVKVLNEDGMGWVSDIIAGIEFAIDPDGDINTDDGAQILSLSLGGFGFPGDALSTAADNAVSQGAICVAAAGNSGNSNYTIQSPGCAAKAITVGSCNSNGVTSYFSSRGPSLITNSIKPDVVAPGENIYSAVPGNKYEVLSGTSMATPYISGVAALLLEKNPDWTPEQVKSIIIQTATKVSNDVLTEGYGLVNIDKSLGIDIVFDPYVMELGIINEDQDIVNMDRTITIYNTSDKSQQIVFQKTDNENGISIDCSEKNFTLLPSESKTININIKIDQNNLIVDNLFPIVQASFRYTQNQTEGIVPFVVSIGKPVRLDFSENAIFCRIFNDTWDSKISIPIIQQEQSIILNKGNYDFLVAFNNFNKYVLHENIEWNNLDSIHISDKEATNELILKAQSPNGERLNLLEFEESFRKPGNIGFRLYRYTLVNNGIQYLPDIKKTFSSFSNQIEYESTSLAFPSLNKNLNQIIAIPLQLDKGINESLSVIIDESSYKKIKFNIDLDNYTDSLYTTVNFSPIGSFQPDPFQIYEQKIGFPYRFDYYLIPFPSTEFFFFGSEFALSFWNNKDSIDETSNEMKSIVATGFLSADESGEISIFNRTGVYKKTFLDDAKLECVQNLKALSYLQVIQNKLQTPHLLALNDVVFQDSVTVRISDSEGTKFQNTYACPKLYLQFGENEVDYQLSWQDSISVSAVAPFNDSLLTKMEFTCQYNGMEVYNWQFPTNIRLSDNSTKNKSILDNGENSISFRGEGYKNYKLWIKEHFSGSWKELPVALESITDFSNTYIVNLENTDPGIYDLKIEGSYQQGDKTSSLWSPGFYISNGLESDSLALVELYNNTDGPSWKNNSGWLSSDLKDWAGIEIQDGRVKSIILNDNNLQNEIPSVIANLTELKTLDVSGNDITKVPDLSIMKNLTLLSVQNNKLDFSSLIPNKDIAEFNFSPQDSLIIIKQDKILEDDFIELKINNYTQGNDYNWYKNDVFFSSSDSTTLSLGDVAKDNSGQYFCLVSNNLFPDFNIPTIKVTLNVLNRLFESYNDNKLSTFNSYISCTSWIDIDNDGDEDLFVGDQTFGKSRIYINKFIETGNPTLEPLIAHDIFEDALIVNKVYWADFNNDGLEDVAMFCGEDWLKLYVYENHGNLNFTKKEIDVSLYDTFGEKIYNACWADIDADNYLELVCGYSEKVQNGLYNRGVIIENNEGDVAQDPQIAYNFADRGFLFADLTDDIGIEVIRYEGRFRICKQNINYQDAWDNDIAIIPSNDAQIASLGDFDNDGDLDIFSPVLHSFSVEGDLYNNLLIENKGQSFLNRSDLSPTFQWEGYSNGSVCFDYDNDGDLDLAVANGGSFNELFINTYSENKVLDFEPAYFQLFDDEVNDWRGVSASDINLDGYLDLVKVSTNEVSLFMNQNSYLNNNWLGIKCIGRISNGSGIGAKVDLFVTINGQAEKQYREVLPLSGNHSLTSKQLHFGLGNASIVDSIIILWPSGIEQKLSGIEVNQNIIVEECNTPIPVSNLSAEYNEGNINLAWNNNDIDEDKLIVEYKIIGTEEIIPLDTLDNTTNSWDFTSSNPSQLMFRLRSYNSCGSSSASALVNVHITDVNDSEIGPFIYPNPTKDFVNINTQYLDDKSIIKFLDINGRLIESRIVNKNTSIKWDVSNLAKGVYTIQYIQGKILKSSSILVQ